MSINNKEGIELTTSLEEIIKKIYEPLGGVSQIILKYQKISEQLLEEIPKDQIKQMNEQLLEEIPKDQIKQMSEQLLQEIPKDMMKQISEQLREEIPKDTLKQISEMIISLNVLAKHMSTPMNQALLQSLRDNDLSNISKIIQDTLEQTYIKMPDMYFLKLDVIKNLYLPQLDLPRGLKSTLGKLNKSTLNSLSYDENINYNKTNKLFILNENTEETATPVELNAISTFKTITKENGNEIILEKELIEFMNYLYSMPNFGSMHPVGIKILNFVKGLTRKEIPIDEIFYHARAYDKDDIPFLNDEMLKAPLNVPGPGRFNHTGQSHFYFTDNPNGARIEVEKHMNKLEKEEKSLQIASLVITERISIIDLSQKSMRGYNIFLKYLKFPQKGNEKLPKVYLIPMYVADCCKFCGIEGIKYYGGKDYSNFVIWEDKKITIKEPVELG